MKLAQIGFLGYLYIYMYTCVLIYMHMCTCLFDFVYTDMLQEEFKDVAKLAGSLFFSPRCLCEEFAMAIGF